MRLDLCRSMVSEGHHATSQKNMKWVGHNPECLAFWVSALTTRPSHYSQPEKNVKWLGLKSKISYIPGEFLNILDHYIISG